MVWHSIGPTTQLTTREFALNNDPNGDFPGTVAGRTQALAFSEDISPRNHIPALFNGAGSGGLWRTTDITGAHVNQPGWILVSPEPGGVQRLDGTPVIVLRQRGINRIGALAQSYNLVRNVNVIYAGTGDPETRGGAGVLRSESGGDPGSWRLVSQQPELVGKSITKIVFGSSPR
jgi:hypothetical protein